MFMPRGFKYSSLRNSPGLTGGIFFARVDRLVMRLAS